MTNFCKLLPAKSNSLKRAIKSISRYRKTYGFSKAMRVIFHYTYRLTKKIFFKKSLSKKIVDVNGYKLHIIPDDTGISSELLMFGTHEPITTKLTTKILREGMTCLDIGSNLGYYALLESKKIGENGKVISIEPSPFNYQHLKKSISLQHIQNIDTYNFAAGDKNGTTKFLLYEESNGCMTIPDGKDAEYPGKVITVPVKKIDTFLEDIKPLKIDFLRMDVEGYEYYIFQGMQETLRKFKPLIQIEVHTNIMGMENTEKFLKMLQENEYSVLYYLPRDLDIPFIGSLKDVKNFNFEKLFQLLNQKKLPSFFMLILKHKENLP